TSLQSTVGDDGTSTSSAATTTLAESSSTVPAEDGSSTGPQCGAAIGTCDAIDVLFVVDSSGSMSEEFAAFIPALSNFSDLLEQVLAGPCSYHIGVTSTEPAPDFQPASCQVRGALSRSGALLGGESCWGDDGHPPYVTEDDDISTLGCLLAVGQNNADDEKQLDTTIAALSPELAGAGGCNEGFLRDDAALVIVIISDEDDDDDSADPLESPERTGSAGDPSLWFDTIGAIRAPVSTGVLALVASESAACPPWMPGTGTDDGTGAEFAARILTFTQHYAGVGHADHVYAGDICTQADELLDQIGNIVSVIEAVCADHIAQ
ncbi:MAG: hypothetical protein IAG13_03110, partial [Deltaproteobacteria bacterium]|nr:hypothetical protein [Nannocystaceae bacterium]